MTNLRYNYIHKLQLNHFRLISKYLSIEETRRHLIFEYTYNVRRTPI